MVRIVSRMGATMFIIAAAIAYFLSVTVMAKTVRAKSGFVSATASPVQVMMFVCCFLSLIAAKKLHAIGEK